MPEPKNSVVFIILGLGVRVANANLPKSLEHRKQGFGLVGLEGLDFNKRSSIRPVQAY